MQYRNWVMKDRSHLCFHLPHGLLSCLKTCVAEAVAYGAGEDQGWGDGGCLGQGAAAFLSHHRSPQGRQVQKGRVTAEVQWGFRASGQTWRSRTLKSGNSKLPIALETGGKEMAPQTKPVPGLTMCLSLPTRRPFFAQGALTGFSDLQALCHNFYGYQVTLTDQGVKWETRQNGKLVIMCISL